MTQSTQKKILVVDDEPDIVEFLQALLRQDGYAVTTTSQGEHAEQIHGNDLPDLILMDIFLSGKDGREIVRHLKSREETRHIPIILFSAHPNTEESARAVGADDFVAKPFDVERLLTKIAGHFSAEPPQ
jgi:CheY-like chemotaxis protein